LDQRDFLLLAKQNWGDFWFVGGDWNEITGHEDKKGGRTSANSSFKPFNGFIDNLGGQDLGLPGPQYTWENCKSAEGYVEERLDRVFASISWAAHYLSANALNVFRSSSDHNLLLLKPHSAQTPSKKRFIFDQRWVSTPGIQEVVDSAWSNSNNGTPMFNLQSKIKNTRVEVLKWSKDLNSDRKKKQDQLHSSLEQQRLVGTLG
ncbi:retrotransposon protein, partial [Striga asiatica]